MTLLDDGVRTEALGRMPVVNNQGGRLARLTRFEVWRRLGVAVLALVVGWLVLAPLVFVESKALRGDALGRALRTPNLGSIVLTTLKLAVLSSVLALVLGVILAFAAVHLSPRWRWLDVVPALSVVLPAVANITGWTALLSPRPGYLNSLLRKLPWWSGLKEGPVDVYSTTWIALVVGFGLTSFAYLFIRTGMRGINPEVVEAARLSGSSPLQAFRRVVLPLLRPSLVYGGIVVFMLSLGQFTAPLLLGARRGIRVVTTEMYRYTSQTPTDYGRAAALASPLLLVGIGLLSYQRFALRHAERHATMGGRSGRTAWTPSRWAPLPIVAFGVVGVLGPMLALMIVSVSPFWTGEVDLDLFTLDNYRKLFDREVVVQSIRNSLMASGVAVAVSLPLGYVLANTLLARRESRIRRLLEIVVSLPLSMPAVLFGIGFLLAYSEGPLILYGTPWVIVVVYVTLMLPFTTRMQMAGLTSLGADMAAAARTAGASPLRTHRTIIIPLMRGAIGNAAALIFVLCTHEFAASLLVRSGTQQVMGTMLYEIWNGSAYPQAAAMALVMTAITAVGVAAAVKIGGRDALAQV